MPSSMKGIYVFAEVTYEQIMKLMRGGEDT